jgi:hypothetical protein
MEAAVSVYFEPESDVSEFLTSALATTLLAASAPQRYLK